MSGVPAAVPAEPAQGVLRVSDTDRAALDLLLARYGISLVFVADGESIPGSYWGESEAGLMGGRLFVRPDTPVHSVLHEASHYICMASARRAQLDRDAGGDDDEESAVCYLQVLLAAQLPGIGGARLMLDMDAWGYTFRLGGTRAWFEADAEDAQRWLQRHAITGAAGTLSGNCRS